jgi:hypothetical protein
MFDHLCPKCLGSRHPAYAPGPCEDCFADQAAAAGLKTTRRHIKLGRAEWVDPSDESPKKK